MQQVIDIMTSNIKNIITKMAVVLRSSFFLSLSWPEIFNMVESSDESNISNILAAI